MRCLMAQKTAFSVPMHLILCLWAMSLTVLLHVTTRSTSIHLHRCLGEFVHRIFLTLNLFT